MAITGAINAFSGIAKAAAGKSAAAAAKIEADKARIEMEKQKDAFAALDTSNPYANMENTMEDLTVNQQQAEFEKQNNMQNQANIMGQMRGAAGSSGIAALAQSLSNQGSLDAQRASASIGAQEAQNQKLSAAEASKNQALERQGEMQSRNMQFGKTKSLLSMAAGDVSNAQAMEAAGNQQRMAGIGDALGGVTDIATSGLFGGNKTTAATDTTTVPVVGGTAQVGGISTPQNVTGQNEVTGATGGGNTSWDMGNSAPQFGYVDGVWQQIN
tara:strand:- start:612 stop:1424 length:813 start_codon:yes stop_codon:yes gene_type:complete